MILLTSDKKMSSDLLFLIAGNNWLTSVIILTADKKLASDFPFLTANKNWHLTFVLQSRGTMAATATLVTTTTTAYHEEDIAMETNLVISAVTKQHIVKSMCECYNRRNILFIIWLFDNHIKYPNLLEPNIYNDLKTQDVIDEDHTTRNGKKSKARENIQKYSQNALRGINPGVDQSIPVNLYLLDFKVFSTFISTFKKIVKRRYHKGQEVHATDGTIAR